jgi:hypothetical protein
MHPTLDSWELVALSPRPSTGRGLHAIGGTMSAPSTLVPPPTPPDVFQRTATDWGFHVPGGGFADSCFTYHIPTPPRPGTMLDMDGVVLYWALDEADAIEVLPGETKSVTTYVMAYTQYAISADAGPDVSASCAGAVTRVPVSGQATLIDPASTATVSHRWSSSDPAVTFADPTAASTEAIVAGLGTFQATYAAAVGAYQATDDLAITIADTTPPDIRALSVSPSLLWPPNHRMRAAHVTLDASDACDPAPTVKLVAVTSNEPGHPRLPGAGNAEPDISDAAMGTDDRDVNLRAERSGRNVGRVYTLTYELADASGNTTRQSVEVRVPHDRRRGSSRR